MTRSLDQSARAFTEKNFYLGEFRGRSVGIAFHSLLPDDRDAVEAVLAELEGNATDVVLFSTGTVGGAPLASPLEVSIECDGLEGAVWRGLRETRRIAIAVPPGEPERTITRIAVQLGLAKLVWLDSTGGLTREGQRVSFVDLEELSGLLRAGPLARERGRGRLLREIQSALRDGLSAVNLTTAAGLADELFTYAGSGTLFTAERYIDVRRLCLDDFDAADDLVKRGVNEGYLAERTPEELDRIFANGYGAFIEGRHLAGIGAVLPFPDENAAEIASLYALTRFHGEGVGGHLVRALCGVAKEQGRTFVFACTTTEGVAGFFEREGFARVDEPRIPLAKWKHYDAKRRPHVVCLRINL